MPQTDVGRPGLGSGSGPGLGSGSGSGLISTSSSSPRSDRLMKPPPPLVSSRALPTKRPPSPTSPPRPRATSKSISNAHHSHKSPRPSSQTTQMSSSSKKAQSHAQSPHSQLHHPSQTQSGHNPKTRRQSQNHSQPQSQSHSQSQNSSLTSLSSTSTADFPFNHRVFILAPSDRVSTKEQDLSRTIEAREALADAVRGSNDVERVAPIRSWRDRRYGLGGRALTLENANGNHPVHGDDIEVGNADSDDQLWTTLAWVHPSPSSIKSSPNSSYTPSELPPTLAQVLTDIKHLPIDDPFIAPDRARMKAWHNWKREDQAQAIANGNKNHIDDGTGDGGAKEWEVEDLKEFQVDWPRARVVRLKLEEKEKIEKNKMVNKNKSEERRDIVPLTRTSPSSLPTSSLPALLISSIVTSRSIPIPSTQSKTEFKSNFKDSQITSKSISIPTPSSTRTDSPQPITPIFSPLTHLPSPSSATRQNEQQNRFGSDNDSQIREEQDDDKESESRFPIQSTFVRPNPPSAKKLEGNYEEVYRERRKFWRDLIKADPNYGTMWPAFTRTFWGSKFTSTTSAKPNALTKSDLKYQTKYRLYKNPFHPDLISYLDRSTFRVFWVIPVHGPVVIPNLDDPVTDAGTKPWASEAELVFDPELDLDKDRERWMILGEDEDGFVSGIYDSAIEEELGEAKGKRKGNDFGIENENEHDKEKEKVREERKEKDKVKEKSKSELAAREEVDRRNRLFKRGNPAYFRWTHGLLQSFINHVLEIQKSGEYGPISISISGPTPNPWFEHDPPDELEEHESIPQFKWRLTEEKERMKQFESSQSQSQSQGRKRKNLGSNSISTLSSTPNSMSSTNLKKKKTIERTMKPCRPEMGDHIRIYIDGGHALRFRDVWLKNLKVDGVSMFSGVVLALIGVKGEVLTIV